MNLPNDHPLQPGKPPTTNLEAYNLYLLGRYHWYNRSEAGFRSAAAYFERAVQLDPGYARAYAGLADVYVQLDGWEFERPNEAMPKAKEFVNKALALDPALAEAFVSLGAIYETYDWDPNATVRAYARAVSLDPGYITGHWWYAAWLNAAGRDAEARQEWDRALKIDPLSVPVLIDSAELSLEAKNEHEAALAQCWRAIQVDPTSSLAYRYLADILETVGKRQEALAALERAVALAPGYPAALSDFATMQVREGRIADARQILNRLLLLSKTQYVPAFVISRIYFALGDQRSALYWLRAARKERSPRIGWYLIPNGKGSSGERFHYGSRDDPQFVALLRQVLSGQ